MTALVSTTGELEPGRSLWQRLDSRLILGTIVITAVVVRAWNLFGYPAFSDDEGTYAAQAAAIQNGWGMAHYTYIYDHPPLGWIQISAVSWLPELIWPDLPAVASARIAMLPFAAVSIVLVYFLARRLRFSTWAALAATALFAFSPLAVTLHRQVFLDNVGVTWLLAAFVLALSPRRHLWLQVLSGVAASVAVLSKETMLLAVPGVLLALRQNTDARTRSFAMIGFVCGFTTTVLFYPLFAALKGELLWTEPDRVSMVQMMWFQLVGRQGTGSVLDGGSDSFATVAGWSLEDPVLLIVGVFAVVAALFIGRLRAAALAAMVPIVLVVARPDGYLPGMLVVQLLPFLVLASVGVVESAVRRLHGGRAAAGVVAAVLAAAVLASLWAPTYRRDLTWSVNTPFEQAISWFGAHRSTAGDTQILTDDVMWLDLVELGYDRQREVLWHYKVDLDSDVRAGLTNGWRDIDLIVSTPAVRRSAPDLPTVDAALRNSEAVAVFGHGDDRVEIRAVTP